MSLKNLCFALLFLTIVGYSGTLAQTTFEIWIVWDGPPHDGVIERIKIIAFGGGVFEAREAPFVGVIDGLSLYKIEWEVDPLATDWEIDIQTLEPMEWDPAVPVVWGLINHNGVNPAFIEEGAD